MNTIGSTWSSIFFQFMRKKTNRLPIIAFAHLHAIFEEKAVGNLNFFEGTLPNKRTQDFNLILIMAVLSIIIMRTKFVVA